MSQVSYRIVTIRLWWEEIFTHSLNQFLLKKYLCHPTKQYLSYEVLLCTILILCILLKILRDTKKELFLFPQKINISSTEIVIASTCSERLCSRNAFVIHIANTIMFLNFQFIHELASTLDWRTFYISNSFPCRARDMQNLCLVYFTPCLTVLKLFITPNSSCNYYVTCCIS